MEFAMAGRTGQLILIQFGLSIVHTTKAKMKTQPAFKPDDRAFVKHYVREYDAQEVVVIDRRHFSQLSDDYLVRLTDSTLPQEPFWLTENCLAKSRNLPSPLNKLAA